MAISRRQFLKGAAITGIGLAMPTLPFRKLTRRAYAFSQSPALTKFKYPLPGLGGNGIPLASKTTQMFAGLSTDVYKLGVKKFSQQIPGLPNSTHFLGYHDYPNGAQGYLGGVIVAKRGTPVLFYVTNELADKTDTIIPVDPTVMMGGGKMVMDYPLNRIAVHLHGGLTPWFSDGTPFQWISGAANYQAGPSFMNVPGTNPPKGTLTNYYPMDQSARLVWYHDHAMGITRTNAYCGIASGLVITDDFETDLIKLGLLPALVGPLDIPLIIQDKMFFDPNVDPNYPITGAKAGDLWYPWQYEANILPVGGPPPTSGNANPNGRWDYGPTVGLAPSPPTPPPNAVLPNGPPFNASFYTLPAPSLVPEFFADTILINGGPYPTVAVPPKRVRFRILNGSQARAFHLNLFYENPVNSGEVTLALTQLGNSVVGFANKPDLSQAKPGPVIYQIGTEGGFLPQVAVHNNTTVLKYDLVADPLGNAVVPDGPFNLAVAPAERADVIIDFNGIPAGTSFILYNDAPAPFPMGDSRNDYFTGDGDQTGSGGAPNTAQGQGPNTRTLMKITVSAGTPDPLPTAKWVQAMNIAMAANFVVGNQPPLLFHKNFEPWVPKFPYTGAISRMLTLNEDFDEFGRLIQRIGTTTSHSLNNQGLDTWGLPYDAAATETPSAGSTEVWQIFNLTADTHPIHFHLVNVQILQRQKFLGDPINKITFVPNTITPPDPNEIGWKETVRMNPGEVTTVMMKFDLPKLPKSMGDPKSPRTGGHEYVWHCHILEHEEHDMMRPLVVL